MAKQAIATIKNWFKKGLKPTESQFADWLDSFWHKDANNIPVTSIEGLSTTLNDLAPLTAIDDLKGGVSVSGNTLKKLYDLIQAIGGGFAIAETYANIAALLADQLDQEDNAWYMVQIATTDPTVSSGWAVYQYLGTTAGTLSDYMKIMEKESLDVVINDATASLKGIMKLYVTVSASNTDGAPSQAAVKTALDLKQDKMLTRERVTDNYTFVISDNHKLKEMNNAAAKAFTIPPNSAVPFPVDETEILLSGYGAGEVSIIAGSGVTINSADGNLKLRTMFSFATAIKIGTNEWYLTGDLKA